MILHSLTTLSGRVRSRTPRVLAAWGAAIAVASPAMAQSNSLFSGGTAGGAPAGGAPTSQPALREVPVLAGVAPRELRKARTADLYENATNPVLLRVSPYAIEVPQAEKIQVNDLVTIIVREIKTSSSDAKLQSDKNWQLDSELSKWFRLDVHDKLVEQSFPDGTPGATFDFKNKYDGEGKVDREDKLTTRITARVIDVKPNGLLALEASNEVANDEEKYVITLTGECRSDDVTPQNTILSTQIHDLKVNVQHTGAARDAARRGWLMRLADLLRPI